MPDTYAREAAERIADKRAFRRAHRELSQAQIVYLLAYYREKSGNYWPPDWSFKGTTD